MIDELHELRAFRAGPPPPPPAAREAARARALGARSFGSHAARRRALLATAAVAAAAGAAIALTSGLDEGHVTPPPATAREALRQIAAVAAKHDDPGVPRDDQYFYVASEGTEMVTSIRRHESYSYLYTKRREIWLSVDRPGALRDHRVGDIRWLTAADRDRWIAQGRPRVDQVTPGETPMEPIRHYFLGAEQMTTAELLAYDPTPRQLFDRLRANVGDRGQSPDGEVFVEIADALREAPQPPKLRATLVEALALVPGVELLGTTKDRLKREAVGIAYTQPNGLRQELLFDPQTSEVLNERQVVAKPVRGLSAPVGTAIEDIVYTRRAVTDAIVRP